MNDLIIIECAFCGKKYSIEELITKYKNFVNICDDCWDNIDYIEEQK